MPAERPLRRRRHLRPALLGLVALGGGVGTALRFALERAFAPGAGEVPWVTFAINVAGSFALGLVLTCLARSGPDVGWRRAVRVGVGTGVIGGFTTYSTFILEVDGLLPGDPVLAGGYALASVVAGIGAAALGVGAAHRIVAPDGASPTASGACP